MRTQMTSTLLDKFTIVENPHEETAAIMLNEEPYSGLVYQYGNVELVEGEPQLNFERTIRKLPDGETDIDKYYEDKNLNQLMGDILVSLIEQQIEKEQEKLDEQTSSI